MKICNIAKGRSSLKKNPKIVSKFKVVLEKCSHKWTAEALQNIAKRSKLWHVKGEVTLNIRFLELMPAEYELINGKNGFAFKLSNICGWGGWI